jgi:hypothetical protein
MSIDIDLGDYFDRGMRVFFYALFSPVIAFLALMVFVGWLTHLCGWRVEHQEQP